MSIPYAVGGGEVRYGLLARELVRRGHEVTWLSMKQKDSLDNEFIDGVKHIHRGPRISAPPQRSPLAMLMFMATTFIHILLNRYDVVDAQTYAPLPAVWLACLLTRQKMIATIHDVSRSNKGQWLSTRFNWLIRSIETVLYRIPYRRIVTVSKSTADALICQWNVNRDRICVIENGIELPSFALPGNERDIDLIFAGRFVPTKNINELVDISRICHNAGVANKVLLVGEGPLIEPIKTQISDQKMDNVIQLIGRRNNGEVLNLLKRSKIFFHASSREGFPVVMVEAMACETPIVAYAVPGVIDAVDDRTGLLVDEHDTHAHAEACIKLLKCAASREEMGKAGRAKVLESLTLHHMVDRIVVLYKS